MKKRIKLSVLMVLFTSIFLTGNISTAYEKCGFAYSYTYENGYVFSMQGSGVFNEVESAGDKVNIKSRLTFAPEWHDWFYDYDTDEWFEYFPALDIDTNNLKVTSSDESKLMITRENGEVYLNYIEPTDEPIIISVEYTYDNYTYYLETEWGVEDGPINTNLVTDDNDIDYLYGYDAKNGYELYLNASSITGYEHRPGTVGRKETISHYLTFAPEDNDWIYDSNSGKWVEINPALDIDESNLEVTSSDETVLKVTRENGKVYLNYLKSTDDNDVILTIKYTYNGETYIIKSYWGIWNQGENGVTRSEKEKDIYTKPSTAKMPETVTTSTEDSDNNELKVEESSKQHTEKNKTKKSENKTITQIKESSNIATESTNTYTENININTENVRKDSIFTIFLKYARTFFMLF